MEKLLRPPPWICLLNAMQKEWRELEIEQGRNPDPYLEKVLRTSGKLLPAELMLEQ